MTTPAGAVWLLRTVLPDGRGPAPGIPVTILDADENPAGYWMSDAEGLVAIPRSDAVQLRLRVGLRSEAPVTVSTEALSREIVEVTAPKSLVPAVASGERSPAPRARSSMSVDRAPEIPGHVLHFARLALLPVEPTHPQGLLPPGPSDAGVSLVAPLEFFDLADTYSATLRYGVLIDIEQFWQPLGYATGDLLYSVAIVPGDEARVVVVDGRWPDAETRPLDALARMIGAAAQVQVLTADDTSYPLDPLMLAPSAGPAGLSGAASDTIHWLNDRTTRMSHALHRRPLRVTEVVPERGPAAVRTLRNLHGDQIVTYHFFEPLERWRVTARAARLRPAVLVPFRLPALATREVVRQFGHVFRRVLLDRSLEPDLERMLTAAPELLAPHSGLAAVSELRLIVQRAEAEQAPDLRHVWCFLHVDNTRYTVHFFPTDAVAGVDAPTATPHWIGAIRLADFHRWPLRYPGAVSIQNGSGSMLAFAAVHLEGRVAENWVRLHTIANLVLPPNAQVRLASLATLVTSQGIDPREGRLLAHIAANVPSYSAAIIAGGDPGWRHLALSKIRSSTGHALAEDIENTVAGVVGNYLAFPLRTPEFAPPGLRAALEQYATRPVRVLEETVLTLPLPGVWVSAQAAAEQSDATEASTDDRTTQRNRRTGWPR